jgi:DHA3 family macrolide efflux protein-like MFS transporter
MDNASSWALTLHAGFIGSLVWGTRDEICFGDRDELPARRTPIEAGKVVAESPSAPLIRNNSFLLLWTGQFISQMGDRLAMVAFPWLVYESTRSTLSTGVVFALYTLPYILFGPVAGVLIDRLNKRSVMVVADVLRAALVVMVPFAASHSLFAVYVLSFTMATAAVFFEPSKLALLPDIVPPGGLMRANSLMATGENLTEILGYTLAGFMLAFVSTTTAFRIDSASFAISAVALVLMKYRAPLQERAAAASSLWHELREGFRFLRRHRGLFWNTVMIVMSMAGLGAGYPLTFFLAVNVLGGGTRAFGIFEAVIATGYLVGSIALAAMATRVRKGHAMIFGLASMGLSLAAIALANNTWQACIPLFVSGVANSVVAIAVDTYLQEAVPQELRGRVFGVRFTLAQGTYALSVLIGGALAGVFDVRVLFVVAGALIAVPAIAGLFVRDIREA